jgi:hypothetical protein
MGHDGKMPVWSLWSHSRLELRRTGKEGKPTRCIKGQADQAQTARLQAEDDSDQGGNIARSLAREPEK